MLLDKSPEYWAREASLQDLQRVVQRVRVWTEEVAEVLDFAYVERCMRLVGRAQIGAREESLELADHLERVAHDSARAALDELDRPYFARWRMLAEIAHRHALRLDVPTRVLERKHVREILLRLAEAGGRLAQGELTLIPNEGQRSATLKLMEQWDLVERRADGTARIVSITDVGRLAVAEELAAREARADGAATLQRGCTYMYSVPPP